MHGEVVIALAVALATQLAFGLGSKWFKNAKLNTPGKTLLSLSALLVTAIQLITITLSPPAGLVLLVIGSVLNVLAVVVYWWARTSHGKDRPAFAFIPTTPTFLTQGGPYRLIRHPIYTAYLMSWIAGPLLCGQPLLLLTTLWMIGLYWYAARQEEQWFSRSELADDYRRYQNRTGMFFPSPLGMFRR